MIHMALGEHDGGARPAGDSLRARAWEIRLLPVEPLFEPLRSHPRLVALVGKIR
jgi:hypothetical protein